MGYAHQAFTCFFVMWQRWWISIHRDTCCYMNLSILFSSFYAATFLIVNICSHQPESQPFLYVCRLLLQDFSPNSFVEDDKVSESSIADIARFIPKIPMSPSPSMTHVVSIGQLLESVIFPQPLIFVLKHASVYLPLCTPMDELACRSRI